MADPDAPDWLGEGEAEAVRESWFAEGEEPTDENTEDDGDE